MNGSLSYFKRQEGIWSTCVPYSIINRYHLLQVFLLFLIPGFKQVGAQIPELPVWIENVYYVDPGNTNVGDGSYENPWKDFRSSDCYSTVWPRVGWDCDKTAILFKRGTSMGTADNPLKESFCFAADSMYIGSYGAGSDAKLVFRSGTRSFSIEGQGNVIANLELMNLDTISDVLDIRGGPSGTSGKGNKLESLVISGGYRGLTFVRNKTLFLKNITVFNTMDDGIYGGEEGDLTDSVIVTGVHVYGVNKRYHANPTNSSGGDCMQIRSAYLYVENSVLDHSEHGMKFCLINTRTTNNAKTIVKNTTFLMHPHDNHGMYAQNAHIENCYFEGGGTVLMVWGNSGLYNSVFKGYGKDYVYSYSGNNFYNISACAPLVDLYNCTFTDVHTAVEATQRDINVRNCIFYNVMNAFHLGINGINGSGNIHFNADLSVQTGLVNYLQDDGKTKGNTASFSSKDPLFADYAKGNYNLSKNSPAIDAGDTRIYDSSYDFISGYNTSSGWVYYTRKFTDFYTVHSDFNGISRPQKNGYDIGAYEYYEGGDTISANNPPQIIITGEKTALSGTVHVLDASGSNDPDNDSLVFKWILPANISSTDINSPVIKILPPFTGTEKSYPVTLEVSDREIKVKELFNLTVLPYHPEIPKVKAKKLFASEYQEPNLPENLVDNSLETRWSAPGENQWAEFEFDTPVSVSHLYISFYQGQKRYAYFDLLGSNDEVGWVNIIEYEQSSGFSQDMELFVPSLKKSDAVYRFIRLVGHGNTENEWNSINEVMIYGTMEPLNVESKKTDIQLYPNPASDWLRANTFSFSKNIPLLVSIFDQTGRIVYNWTFDITPEEIVIPVSGLLPGIYLVRFSNKVGDNQSARFIKQ